MAAETLGRTFINSFFSVEKAYIEAYPVGVPLPLREEHLESAPPVWGSACQLRVYGNCPFGDNAPDCSTCSDAKATIETFREIGGNHGFVDFGKGSIDTGSKSIGWSLKNSTNDIVELRISGQLEGSHLLKAVMPRKRNFSK